VGFGEAADFVVGEAGGFDGGEDLGLRDVGLAFGVDDPDAARGGDVFLEEFKAFERAFRFDTERDMVWHFDGVEVEAAKCKS